MLKEHEPRKMSASERAARRWKNAELRKRLREEKQKPKLTDPDRNLEVAETVVNCGNIDGQVRRFERKFIKEIRAMLEDHANKNLAAYALSLQHRRYILLKEKLRRLQAAQQEVSNVQHF
jgi:hypothetical protein